MIVDSSALIAMLNKEAGYQRLARALVDSEALPQIASGNFLETAIVADGRRDPVLSRRFDDLLDQFDIEIVSFTPELAEIARQAYRDFGKGSGHPAKLNFGDCMAYALARSEGKPLLYVGNDFTHTDIEAA
ncbi:type II toxin-antitoxin system VapC family toxin [Novosphingobium sp. Gsoil 351]|uniref:type II toxin-antitoxin system VapC family toxin n=1 Tax=Novosphingobium sp. Gsoil 351 TaxID=2675225 RepID=UPI0012B46A15|nr:type II toxin-antitoxin system VapC family toxin [Novosphingobium sp. Gsoil 351]QGN56064.1 PIN domain-containing protein [Novosphingobium sp. Gsoil 351]